MNMKSLIFALSFGVSTSALFAESSFTDVSIRQRWPWSQKVDVTYTLVGDDAGRVSLELYSGSTKLTVPQGALSGDLWGVSHGGPHTITFDPAKTAYTNKILDNVRAVLSANETPLYMIVDLTKNPGEENQITYVTAYDLTNSASTYGSWTNGSYYHTGPYIDSRWQDTIVWTGVTNSRLYKTTSMVFRYIPAGTFTMGSPTTELGRNADHEKQHEVTLTKAMFAGVFALTQAQYTQAVDKDFNGKGMGEIDATICPTIRISYNFARNPTNEPYDASIAWPKTGHTVATNSLLAVLRAKLGNDLWDLPTEAQYEYTCRAGTTGAWNNGATITNVTADAELTKLALYNHVIWTVQPVGMKLPNGWGLYDMHGNAWNWCLDWYTNYTAAVTDPVGSTTAAATRCLRNGGWYQPASVERSAAPTAYSANLVDDGVGIRLYWTLE